MTRRGRGKRSALVSESQLKALNDGHRNLGASGSRRSRPPKAQAQAERRRLERLRKAAPILRRLARPAGGRGGFCRSRPPYRRKPRRIFRKKSPLRDRAREQAEQARKKSEAARAEREAAQPDADVLAQGETIEALIRASGAFEKSVRRSAPTRNGLAGGAPKARSARAGLRIGDARRICAPPRPIPRRSCAPEKLAARGRDLALKRQQPERDLAEEESRLAALGAQQGEALPEAEALREKLRAFGEVERLDAAFRDASRLRDDNARQLAEAQGRLSPPLPDLDLFARRPSPEASAIEQAARAFDDFSARDAAQRAKARAGD